MILSTRSQPTGSKSYHGRKSLRIPRTVAAGSVAQELIGSRSIPTMHKAPTPITPTFDDLPNAAFARQTQIIPHVVPFSSATLWRKCKAGTFPAPVKLSERVTAWNVGAVRAWLTAQAAA